MVVTQEAEQWLEPGSLARLGMSSFFPWWPCWCPTHSSDRKAKPFQKHLLGSPEVLSQGGTGNSGGLGRLHPSTYVESHPPGTCFLRKPPSLFHMPLNLAGVSPHSTSSSWNLKTDLRTPLTQGWGLGMLTPPPDLGQLRAGLQRPGPAPGRGFVFLAQGAWKPEQLFFN